MTQIPKRHTYIYIYICFMGFLKAHFHNFHQFSSIFINFHQFSSIFINFHQFSSIFINFHQFSSIFINFPSFFSSFQSLSNHTAIFLEVCFGGGPGTPGGVVEWFHHAMPCLASASHHQFHWIGFRENLNRKPMGFYHQIDRAFRLKFSHHPIL